MDDRRPHQPPDSAPATILVCDDDPSLRELVRAVLGDRYPMRAGDWMFVLAPALHRDVVWGEDPEAFDPDPYLALLDDHGIHHAVVEMEPGSHRPT